MDQLKFVGTKKINMDYLKMLIQRLSILAVLIVLSRRERLQDSINSFPRSEAVDLMCNELVSENTKVLNI